MYKQATKWIYKTKTKWKKLRQRKAMNSDNESKWFNRTNKVWMHFSLLKCSLEFRDRFSAQFDFQIHHTEEQSYKHIIGMTEVLVLIKIISQTLTDSEWVWDYFFSFGRYFWLSFFTPLIVRRCGYFFAHSYKHSQLEFRCAHFNILFFHYLFCLLVGIA